MEQQQIADTAGLGAYMASIGILGGAVYAVSEVMGRMVKRKYPTRNMKLWLAMGCGPLFSLVAYGAGFLPTPQAGPWAWGFAFIMGTASTFIAKGVNDIAVKPFQKPKGRLP